MDLKELLRGVGRAPWQAVGRIMLINAGFVIHRGLENTIDAALREPEDVERQRRLESALREYAVAGEKLVRIVTIRKAEKRKLIGWIDNKRRTGSALAAAFPAIASHSEIVAAANAPPASVGSVQLLEGRAALFTSARSYLDRVEIPATKLKAGEADGYEKIYAMRRVFVQTYDAIWVPDDEDVVCLVTDLPTKAPSGFSKESQIALESQLRRVLDRKIEPVNLWPAVDGLYKSKEGQLVDHGFVNDTEAVKHHASRRGGKGLREDVYDRAGAAAVGDDLLTFKVAVAWPRKDELSVKARPEVLLPGQAAMLNPAKGLAKLDHAVVRNCLNSRDLNFILSKLLAYAK